MSFKAELKLGSVKCSASQVRNLHVNVVRRIMSWITRSHLRLPGWMNPAGKGNLLPMFDSEVVWPMQSSIGREEIFFSKKHVIIVSIMKLLLPKSNLLVFSGGCSGLPCLKVLFKRQAGRCYLSLTFCKVLVGRAIIPIPSWTRIMYNAQYIHHQLKLLLLRKHGIKHLLSPSTSNAAAQPKPFKIYRVAVLSRT